MTATAFWSAVLVLSGYRTTKVKIRLVEPFRLLATSSSSSRKREVKAAFTAYLATGFQIGTVIVERAIGIRDEPGNAHAPHVGQAKNECTGKNGAVPVSDRLGRRNAAGHVAQRVKGLGFAHVGACALGSAPATLAAQDWRRGPSGGGRPGRACGGRQGGAAPTRGR